MEDAQEPAAQEARLQRPQLDARSQQVEPAEDSSAVCVAVNVRPLIDLELSEGCKSCLQVTPGEPQVGHGAHLFTFDRVFGSEGEYPGTLYERCVAPLVDGLFNGYNATVFAYGQTGSGKTYTMGSAFTPGGEAHGVIPNVMEAIFHHIQRAPRDVEVTVRVGFVEIHKEEIHDLLCTRGPHPAVHIREVVGGGICVAGANEKEVRTREEMVQVLEQGTLLRATAATGMNKSSSRSHAIFTITLEQRKLQPARAADSPTALLPQPGGDEEGDHDSGDDEDEAGGTDDCYLCAKMHLVDLAGSERAKRTKAVGQRLQEGININKGLLALGNVINALSEGKHHVPYRDSKLTRMLQDSLGGNSRTVMIACVSPADVNLEETLNTLRYANRARNIRNKPVVNRDPVAAQIAHMRQQVAALRAENQSLKGRLGMADGAMLDFRSPADEVLRAAVDDLEARNKALKAENKRLHVEVDGAHEDLKEITEKMIVAQAQRDRLKQRLQQLDPDAAAEAAAAADAIADGTSSEGDVVRCQLERIAELEREVKHLKQVSRLSGAFVMSSRRQSLAPGEVPSSPFHLSPFREGEDEDEVSELELNDEEFVAQEQAHSMHVARLQGEMSRLQHEMDAKQAAMHSMSQHSALKQKYDERLTDLQQERDELQKERVDLLHRLAGLQAASEDERLRLKAQYETRIKQLDEKVKMVKAKEKRALELERMKAKAEEACKKLETDVVSIKQQMVALQRQMEKGTREFTDWKRQRDRELLQLKKQGRLNAAQLQKMGALHSKQQAVLRRKTEEAEAARKRLKAMEERQRGIVRPTTASSAGGSSTSSAADRPFTAPPAASSAAAHRQPANGSGGNAAVERSAASASSAGGGAGGGVHVDAECQPNPQAPLLRDEKGRREWVEGELDAYCSSYELQKVVEGERAMRSEVQRKLREVEKGLAALKNPQWWPGQPDCSPSSANEEKLQQRRMALLQQSELHSKQFEQAQAKLMEARQAEEARGGVPGDARRWNGVRTLVQARALLKTVFRSASQHQAQASEAQAQLSELTDQIDLLRLRLDIAEQEKYEAERRAAEAATLLHQAQQAVGGDLASTPTKQLMRHRDEGLREAEEILQQLNVLATDEPSAAAGERSTAAAAEEDEEASASASSEDEDDSSDGDELDEDEEDGEEDEEEQSDDEERYALWDPSTATPARGGTKSRRPAAAAAAGGRTAASGGSTEVAAAAGSSGEAQGQQQRQRRRRSSTTSAGGVLLPEEQPVLTHLNEQLRRQGKEAVTKPTVALMKEVLKDKMVGGQRWRLGSKKREELVRDYRTMLGLKAEVESPRASSAPQPPPRIAADDGAAAASGAGGGRSRVLEHTASSLARIAAVQQHHPHPQQQQQQQQQAPPVPAAASAGVGAAGSRPFGSPLQPAPSRAGTSSGAEQPDSSTPVGAEGLTPEAAGVEGRPRDGQYSVLSPASPWGGGLFAGSGRGGSPLIPGSSSGQGGGGDADGGSSSDAVRELAVQDLRRQLSALQGSAAALGIHTTNAATAGDGGNGGEQHSPTSTASPLPHRSSRLSPRGGDGGAAATAAAAGSAASGGNALSGSFRRSFSLMPWGRSSSSPTREPTLPKGSIPAAAAADISQPSPSPPRLRVGSQSPASSSQGSGQPSSPALVYEQRAEQCKQQAAHATQKIEADLQSAQAQGDRNSSPGRLARLFGRGGGGSGASGGKPLPPQQPDKLATAAGAPAAAAGAGAGAEATYDLHRLEKPAAEPLHSSNGHSRSVSTDAAGAGSSSSRGASPTELDFRAGGFGPAENLARPTSASTSPSRQQLHSSGHGGGGIGRPRSGGGAVQRPPPSPNRKAAWKPL